ncbi:Hypothetical protein A7982_08129 [Minicystis rosea]|nr:Hypothetical protein A7982_08129 [Minicystis rosea]
MRGARKPIARTRHVVLGRLAASERMDLCTKAYAIYAMYKSGVDRVTFEQSYFSNDATRVSLYYGDDGALAGFTSSVIQRVEHEGRRHAVYSALLFIDTRYKGSAAASISCMLEALRFKLTEPSTPLACMGVITSPASYRRFAVTMPTMYPTRRAPVPAAIAALMRRTAELRGLAFVDDDRWLVRGSGAPKHPDRLRGSKTLADDPDARFYLDRNPTFGEGTGLLIWIPLDLVNLGGAFLRYLLRDLA